MADPRYVAVADVAGAHGVRGELKVRLFNRDSAILSVGRAVRLVRADGSSVERRLEGARPVPGGAIVRIEGCDDRDAALDWRQALVEVDRAELPPAPEDEYYLCDLEGCAVVLGEAPVGRVASVARYPTCDALVVAREDGGVLEVPLAAAYVARIDVGARRIELVTLEGL